MKYIVLDMEWNQSAGGCRTLPDGRPLTGEIIEIGAVRLGEGFDAEERFKALVKPVFYRRIHKKVRELTGIDNAMLSESGVPFAKAFGDFLSFCGEDFATVTWGNSDIAVLKENISAHRLGEWKWKNYNLQTVFDRQISHSSKNTALDAAAESLGIKSEAPYHDALNDAAATAEICRRIDMKKALESYTESEISLAALDCIAFETVTGITDVKNAKYHPRIKYTMCPVCRRPLPAERLVPYGSNKKLSRITCPDHGAFLLSVRISKDRDASHRASKYLYEWNDKTKKLYESRLAVADRKKEAFLKKIRGGKSNKNSTDMPTDDRDG